MFVGDYSGKIDAKGRMIIPSQFRKNCLEEVSFILKRSIYDKSLDLYTGEAWKAEAKRLGEMLNSYNREHAALLREYYRGAVELNLDASGRILLPKRLLDFAEITKEVVIVGVGEKMVVWSEQNYESIAVAQGDFEELVGKILG